MPGFPLVPCGAKTLPSYNWCGSLWINVTTAGPSLGRSTSTVTKFHEYVDRAAQVGTEFLASFRLA